jgi:hypothetical protein
MGGSLSLLAGGDDGAGVGAGRPRAGVMAGYHGRPSREGQEKVEVHLRLVPGGEDKGLGAVTP